jgi:GTPase SAR1 family protein
MQDDWQNWTGQTILVKFKRLPSELMEKLITEKCPTGERLSNVTPEVLEQLGFKSGHISLMKKLLESFKIPHHLNPERRIPHHPKTAALAQQIRDKSQLEGTNVGIPVIYKIPSKMIKNISTKKLSVITVGSVDSVDSLSQSDKPEKRILLVGGTGSGKTTWLNSVANYLYGVSWTDDFRFKVVGVNDERRTSETGWHTNQAFSQTQYVTSYKFEWHPGFPCDFSLVVIDTPGFGDTDGVDRDHEIEEQMRNLFEMRQEVEMDKIDAIVLVVQAANVRLTANQRYICEKIENLFGREIGNNLIVAITFADFGDPPVIRSIQQQGVTFRKFFKFNNSALFDANDDPKKDLRLSKVQWDVTFENFDGLVNYLKELQPRSILQRQISRNMLLLLLQGHNHEIGRKLVDLERLHLQSDFICRHRKEIETEEIFQIETLVHSLTLIRRSSHTKDNLFCVFCNTSCAQTTISKYEKDFTCPRRCDSSFHVKVGFSTEYQATLENWTTGQIVIAYSQGDEKKIDADQILSRIEEKCWEINDEIMNHVTKAREMMNQMCGKVSLCLNSDYISLLISAEQAGRRAGYDFRIKQLGALIQVR